MRPHTRAAPVPVADPSSARSMVGALNKLPVAVSGMVFFGNPVNVRSVSAVLLGFTAGVMYTQAKQAQKAAAPIGAPFLLLVANRVLSH